MISKLLALMMMMIKPFAIEFILDFVYVLCRTLEYNLGYKQLKLDQKTL